MTYTPADLRGIAYSPYSTGVTPALLWAADEIERLTGEVERLRGASLVAGLNQSGELQAAHESADARVKRMFDAFTEASGKLEREIQRLRHERDKITDLLVYPHECYWGETIWCLRLAWPTGASSREEGITIIRKAAGLEPEVLAKQALEEQPLGEHS
jgi:hypothetical protein